MGRAEPRVAFTGAALALAAPLGALAASGHAIAPAAAVVAVAVLSGLWLWCRRDPVMVLAALCVFQMVRTPLANGLPGPAGAAADQVTDLVALVLIAALTWELMAPGADRRDLRFLLPAAGLALCGVLSSLLVQAPLSPTLTGLWLAIKLWVLVGLAAAMPWRAGDVDRVLRVVIPSGVVVAGLGLLDFASGGAVADALGSNLSVTQFEFRANAAQSVYATPNEYNLAMSLLVAIAAARVVTRGSARDVGVLLVFIAAAIVSLRLKAVLSVAAVFAVIAAAQVLRARRGGLGIIAVGAVCVIVAVVVQGDGLVRQITTYGSTTETARSQLYDASARIAGDHFPLGVGFGRFATAPSRDHYSDVYDDYGLSLVWGLSRAFPRFIADTSWPGVLGETGVAGLLVCLAALLALFRVGLHRLRRADGAAAFAPLALLCVLAVVVVDSTGNSTMFSWNTATMLALTLGATLAVGGDRRRARAGGPPAALRDVAHAAGPPSRARARPRARRPLEGARR